MDNKNSKDRVSIITTSIGGYIRVSLDDDDNYPFSNIGMMLSDVCNVDYSRTIMLPSEMN